MVFLAVIGCVWTNTRILLYVICDNCEMLCILSVYSDCITDILLCIARIKIWGLHMTTAMWVFINFSYLKAYIVYCES